MEQFNGLTLLWFPCSLCTVMITRTIGTSITSSSNGISIIVSCFNKGLPKQDGLGREIILPLQAIIGRPPLEAKDELDVDTYIQTQHLAATHTLGRIHLDKAATYQKKHYDTKAKRKFFAQGLLVWLHDPSREIGVCSKLRNHWKGHFLITRVVDDLIRPVKQGAKHIVRIRPYNSQNIPTWIARERRKEQSISDFIVLTEKNPELLF